MIVYSKKIIRFISEVTFAIKNILSKEFNLRIHGKRFYDRMEHSSYPIDVVIYDDKNVLGYFDQNFYELNFHECLMQSSSWQLYNVIRHVLVHCVNFALSDKLYSSDSEDFIMSCKKMGWGEEVYKCAICPDHGLLEVEENVVLRKVKKLMALANSSNLNEAEQAMIKSQQLLLKHNIDSRESEGYGAEGDEKLFIKRLMKQKKRDAKMTAIARVLRTFFVNVIFHRSSDFVYLEILGNEVNVKIAEYVTDVLNYELDRLWDLARKSSNLKGMIAKNSFFIGVADGYCDKVNILKKNYTDNAAKALMVIGKQLDEASTMVYGNLSSTSDNRLYCPESSALGKQMGRQLNINPGVNKSSGSSELFIGHLGAGHK